MNDACARNDSPVRAGVGALEVGLVAGQSAVTVASAASPLKLLTPRSRGQSVWVCTSSFGGGLVAGDQTDLRIRVGPGARCFLGTQASTKVYRNPASRPCGHTTTAVLDADSLLVFAPDPVQAFADSIYVQRQQFNLEAGAGLVLVDWFTSGRAARGERWAFKHFQSRNEVFIDGKRAFLDSLRLDPNDGALAASHRMGRFNCSAMLLLIGAALRQPAADLLTDLSAQPVVRRGAQVSSASAVTEGTVLRIAGESVESVGQELRRHLAFVGPLLGDDPFTRKW